MFLNVRAEIYLSGMSEVKPVMANDQCGVANANVMTIVILRSNSWYEVVLVKGSLAGR